MKLRMWIERNVDGRDLEDAIEEICGWSNDQLDLILSAATEVKRRRDYRGETREGVSGGLHDAEGQSL